MGRKHICCAPFGVGLHSDGEKTKKLGDTKRVSSNKLDKLKQIDPHTSVTSDDYICVRCIFEINQRFDNRSTHSTADQDTTAHDNLYSVDELQAPGPSSQGAGYTVENQENPPLRRSPEMYSMYSSTIASTVQQSDVGSVFQDPDRSASVNNVLAALGEPPFDLRKSKSLKYVQEVSQQASDRLLDEVAKASTVNVTPQRLVRRNCPDCSELIEDITHKFKLCSCKNEKYKMLTTFPKSVTINEMVDRVSCTTYEARTASQLRKTNGAFSAPEKKFYGHYKISDEIKHLVIQFYLNPENSTVSPEFRKTINVLNPLTGKKEPVAKHQMLLSQKQFYEEFKAKYTNINISLSTVAMLKPKQCKWGGSTGFLQTCLCEIHQNFELLLNALQINVKTNELLEKVLCDTPAEECYQGVCINCPHLENIKPMNPELDTEGETEDDFEDVEYFYWIKNELIKKTNTKAEIIDKIAEQLPKVGYHHFLLKQQRLFVKELEEKVKTENSMIVHFAENYSFVVQDAIQGHHWTNNQMTIHPFYCQWSPDGENISHCSYIIMSDTRDHNATSIECFRRKLLEQIKVNHPNVDKIYYLSDGTGAQYKNFKNLINIMQHEKDYGIKAECHFTVSYHGKSQCDAISAVVKRSLRIASMRDKVKILTATDAYEYCVNFGKHVDVEGRDTLIYVYVTQHEINQIEGSLEQRYSLVKTIPGTQSYHSFIPLTDTSLETKLYSKSPNRKIVYFGIEQPDLERLIASLKVGMYACFEYRSKWQLGMINDINLLDRHVVISIMRKLKQINTFNWPERYIEFTVTFDEIITLVPNPLFHINNGVFRLPDIDIQRVRSLMDQRKQ